MFILCSILCLNELLLYLFFSSSTSSSKVDQIFDIVDAVESARQSNAAALAALKKQLEDINKNILYLEDYQKKLDEENAELQ